MNKGEVNKGVKTQMAAQRLHVRLEAERTTHNR